MSAPQRLPDPDSVEPLEVAQTERIYDSPWVGLRRDWLELGEGRRQEHHSFGDSGTPSITF